ncbi:hypothetical protein ACVT98_27050 (plasmid) [Vibrio campbellii]
MVGTSILEIHDLVNACLPSVEADLASIIGDKFVIAMKAAGKTLQESEVADYEHFLKAVIAADSKPERFAHLGVMKSEVRKHFA